MAANPQSAPQDQNFELVLVCVVGITIICLLDATYLAKQPQSDSIKSLTQTVQSVFALGCGAIFGLIGGKALR